MSSDLIWLLTRSNSSFLVKRNNTVFSKEPGNLVNKPSLKYSGLAPSKTVAIAPAAKGVTVVTQKSKVAAGKVSKRAQKATIAKPARTSAKSVAGIVKGYRPDLVKVRLHFVQRPRGPLKFLKSYGRTFNILRTYIHTPQAALARAGKILASQAPRKTPTGKKTRGSRK